VQVSNGQTAVMIKEDHGHEMSARLDKYKGIFGIHTIQHTEGMTAVHLVFADLDEKRRLARLLNEKELVSSGEVYRVDCTPAAWSVVVPEEYAVEVAQRLHDWFMEIESKIETIVV